jgi:hypothetical protein
VRSKEEILRTLDVNGRFDELPFMPEMFQYCGRQLRVYKRAHKTCDFVALTGIRKLSNAVHLEDARCDGTGHGGCMAGCLIFWKEIWLRRVSVTDAASAAALPSHGVMSARAQIDSPLLNEAGVFAATVAPGQDPGEPQPTYVCQATQLPNFTQPLSPWDVRAYIQDLRSGNVPSVWKMLPRFLYRLYDNLINLGLGVGPFLRWAYDRFSLDGTRYPDTPGRLAVGSKTPSTSLNLQPGELVRVKSHDAILETVDASLRNRGMSFAAEMTPYCGRTFRVRSRVNRLIDEKTGKMLNLKNECIILDGVVCQAKYNKKMIFCPRATYSYWREIWLERV